MGIQTYFVVLKIYYQYWTKQTEEGDYTDMVRELWPETHSAQAQHTSYCTVCI